MVRLIPKDEAFHDVFVKDGENLLEAARALNAMFTEFDRLDERVGAIQALEHHGDEIDAEIAARLEKSFITPFDREDIHELYTRLDDVVDGIQEAAETVVIYGIDAATDEARRMAGIIDAQAEQLLEALRKLDRLESAGMHLKAVHDLENEADPAHPVRWFILNVEANVEIDITAADGLRALYGDLAERGVRMGLARVKKDLREPLERAGLIDLIGEDMLFLTLPVAEEAYLTWAAEQDRAGA